MYKLCRAENEDASLMKKFEFNGFLQAGGFASLGNAVAVFIRA